MVARRPPPPSLGYRLGVASRAVAGAVGGYACAALAAIMLAVALPEARIGAAITATLIGILVAPIVAMACFWARSAGRAWAGVTIACALFAGIAWLAGWRP